MLGAAETPGVREANGVGALEASPGRAGAAVRPIFVTAHRAAGTSEIPTRRSQIRRISAPRISNTSSYECLICYLESWECSGFSMTKGGPT